MTHLPQSYILTLPVPERYSLGTTISILFTTVWTLQQAFLTAPKECNILGLNQLADCMKKEC